MQGAEKISAARIGCYVSKKFFPQRRSRDEIWIYRSALKCLTWVERRRNPASASISTHPNRFF